MLSIRSAVVFAILALFEVVAAATPPGCLLAAVNTQKDPSDMKALCGSASKQVQNEITKVCNGPDVKNALDAYSKTCSESGNKVEIVSVSNTTLATVSATSSSTRSATASVGATATPTATGSGSGSGSSSSSSSSSGRAPTVTGNTASSIKSKSLAVAAIAAMVGAAAM